MESIRPKIRSRIEAKDAPRNCRSTPTRTASDGEDAKSAGSTNIFVGMQPTLRQVPPNAPESMIAARRSAKSSSRIVFPDPEPMTTMS